VLKRRPVIALLCLSLFGLPAVGDTLPACVGQTDSSIDSVTVKAVGDIVLGNNFPSGSFPPNYEQDTAALLKSVIGEGDVIFGNFEGALTTHNFSPKTPRGTSVFAFRMPPHFALLLKNAGFNAMAIANNHTFDFGAVGYEDTRKHLANAGMTLIGEPHAVSLQKVRGIAIGWIGFSHLPHQNYIGDLARLEQMMKSARQQADLVIVSMQAGAEGSEALIVRDKPERYLGEERGNTFRFARRAVELGADLVIGHGPHVLRGMECYRGRLIAYSLGNFAGYGAFSTRQAAAISAVLEVRLAKDRTILGYNLTPVIFDDNRLPLPDSNRLAHYLVNDLSRRAPLNGTIQFPGTEEGESYYRNWIATSGLSPYLLETKPLRNHPAATTVPVKAD
jgi:poly-gamma-glutamate synthesis protein (capsule biosynthesis protein)